MALATRFASIARATLSRSIAASSPSFSAPSILRSCILGSSLSALRLPSILNSPTATAIRCFTVPAAFRNESKRGPASRRPGRRAAKLLSKIKVCPGPQIAHVSFFGTDHLLYLTVKTQENTQNIAKHVNELSLPII